jgi:hypothetical protein
MEAGTSSGIIHGLEHDENAAGTGSVEHTPSTAVPPELIGRIAPTRTEGINLRGVFSFPIEQYAEQLLPS